MEVPMTNGLSWSNAGLLTLALKVVLARIDLWILWLLRMVLATYPLEFEGSADSCT